MKISVLFILIILFSCADRSNKPNKASTKKNETVVTDTSWTEKLAIALNLPIIDQGVDSFELRLWSSLSGTDLQMLTILRFSNRMWHCTESRYWVGRIDEWGRNRSLSADSVLTKKILPKIPFTVLLDSLEHYEIFKIPSQQEIPGFIDKTADGMNYTLELARPHHHCIISYRNPQAYADTINKRFNSLLKFLNKSIGAFVMQ